MTTQQTWPELVNEVQPQFNQIAEVHKLVLWKAESQFAIQAIQKNKHLSEYAFINSHLLRAPLCRLLGLIQLLEYTDISDADAELLKYLLAAGEELDGVVEKINSAIENGSYFDRDIISGNLKPL